MSKREVKLDPGTTVELTSLRTRRKVTCTVTQPLGVGGTAKVYAGTLEDGQHVVLKVQRYQGEIDPGFEVEVELFRKLFHRNIVHCVGVGTTSAQSLVIGFRRAYQNPLLLMTKSSVAEEMRRDRKARYPSLPFDAAIDFGYELLNALDYLERLGIVHHDVKLANLLVDVAPRARPLEGNEVFGAVVRRAYRGILIDFGATRSVSYLEAWNKGEAPEGLAPQITPLYAPPESLVETRQPDGKLRVTFDPSLDVYAAALVLYALFTGHPPYSHLRTPVDLHDLESIIGAKSAERRAEIEPVSADVIHRVVAEDTRFVGGDRASFDLAFHRFLLQRLHPDPAQRGTASDMKREFEKLCLIKSRRSEGGDQLSGRSRVFLPFTQELVEVGGRGGEHPLYRAARAYGVSLEVIPTEVEGAKVGAGSSAEAPKAPPASSLDWLEGMGGSGDGQVVKPAGAGSSSTSSSSSSSNSPGWLDAMDATPKRGAAAPRPAEARRRSDESGVRRAPARPGREGSGGRGRESSSRQKKDASGVRRKDAPGRQSKDASGVRRKDASGRLKQKDASGVRRKDASGRLKKDASGVRRKDASRARRRESSESGRGPSRGARRPGQESSRRVAPTRDGESRSHTRSSGKNRRPPQAGGGRKGRNPYERPLPVGGQLPHVIMSAVIGDPVLLSREREHVIGRDSSLQLRIKSDLISRRHARVYFDGKCFRVVDLGSLNGTFVNGVKVGEPCPLEDGDRITLGGFELTVKVLKGGGQVSFSEGAGGTTRIMYGGKDMSAALPSASFTGDLGQLALRDVIEILEWKKQTGTLLVTPRAGTPGRLYFAQGRIVHAEDRRGRGREAALGLLKVSDGRFSFAQGAIQCPRSIESANQELLRQAGA